MKRFSYLLVVVLFFLSSTTIQAQVFKWRAEVAPNSYAASLIALSVSEDTIHTVAGDGHLRAYNSRGDKLWENSEGEGWKVVSPSVLTNGTVVYSTAGGVHAVNRSGETLWSYNNLPRSQLAIANNNDVFAYGADSLFRIKANGDLAWNVFIDSTSGGLMIRDGLLYTGTKRGLKRIDPTNGQILKTWPQQTKTVKITSSLHHVLLREKRKHWISTEHGGFWVTRYVWTRSNENDGFQDLFTLSYTGHDNVTVGNEQRVFASRGRNKIICFSLEEGRTLWDYEQGRSATTGGATIATNGLYYGTHSGSTNGMVLLSFDGEHQWTYDDIPPTYDVGPFPAVAKDGTIYFYVSRGNKSWLYAVATSSKGLAKTPWPRYGHDNQNTNNFDRPIQNSVKIGDRNTPTTFAIEQNYPNPFNMATEIVYQLPEAGYVTLSIYNSLGQKIRTLVSRNQNAGRYVAHWDGRDEQGNEVTSGVYIYRLETAKFNDVKKMLLIK